MHKLVGRPNIMQNQSIYDSIKSFYVLTALQFLRNKINMQICTISFTYQCFIIKLRNVCHPREYSPQNVLAEYHNSHCKQTVLKPLYCNFNCGSTSTYLGNLPDTKGQIISDAFSKKRTKNFFPSSQGKFLQIFRLFFGQLLVLFVCYAEVL